jgi:hypothetical protein
VFDALVEKERSLSSTRTRLALAAATEVTAGVFVFQRVAYVGPKVLAEHRLLMSAPKPFADVNRVSRHV